MKKRASQKNTWFVAVRGSYLSCSWQGWLTYVPMVAFVVLVTMAIVDKSDTISDVLFGLIPYYVCTAVVMHWIASIKS